MADHGPAPADPVEAVRSLEKDAEEARKRAIHEFSLILTRKHELESVGLKVRSGLFRRLRRALNKLTIYDVGGY